MTTKPKINQYLMVWRGKLAKTSGGLTKSDLIKNKRGKIVSKKRSELAKRRFKLKPKTAEQMAELRKRRK